MRVLHVVATDQRRGAEVFASDLIRSLDEAGVAQRVAVLRRGEGSSVTYDAPITALTSNGWHLPGLRINAARIVALRQLIGRWGPEVIQVHGGEALKYSVFAGRAPIVYRKIGSAAPASRTRSVRMAYTQVIRRAAKIIAVSEATKRDAISTFRIPPDRVVTIPGGVDVRRLHPGRSRDAVRAELGISSTAIVILSLGALVSEKDPLAHLRVMAPVLDAVPEAVHVLAGDGPMRRDVEDAVEASELKQRISVLGSREDTADLLGASDVVLLASRTEGMPACLIEAGMADVPVVAYSVGGVPEVVVDGVTGMLVRPGDEDRLSRSMLHLIGDPVLRRNVGLEGGRRCRAEFDIGVVTPRYLEVYDRVVSKVPLPT